jgi:hypothetical protein
LIGRRYEERVSMINDVVLNSISKIKYEDKDIRDIIWNGAVR